MNNIIPFTLKDWNNAIHTAESYKMNYIFFIGIIFYLPLIKIGQKIMVNREPIKLNFLFFTWNIVLSILSFIGFFYSFRTIYILNKNLTIKETICNYKETSNFLEEINHISNMAVASIYIYTSTKILEWIDTLFLVLRKRKIIFLHWFHHLFTMIYCWHKLYYTIDYDFSGLYFSSVNLFVHGIMYMYYALKIKKIYIPPKISVCVTFLQLSQMFFGIYILIKNLSCNNQINYDFRGLGMGVFMYSVYLYEF